MNAIGMITHEADIGLRIGSHEEIATFAVADIGDDDIILGIDCCANTILKWIGARNT